MPKINPTPISRPATPGVTIPANHSQKVNTGQSPGKPATSHQVPSCGVIQITHKPTNENFICSTAEVKKTLKNIFKGCHSETIAANHPKLCSCFNGGTGQVKNVKTGGGINYGGGSPMFDEKTGKFLIKSPVGGLAGPCFVGDLGFNDINLPMPKKNLPNPWGPCGTNLSLDQGYTKTTFVKNNDVWKRTKSPVNYTPSVDYWAKPSNPPCPTLGPSPRPTSKNTWDVNWLCRFDRNTVKMDDLIKYEIAFKEAIQPTLNGDRHSTTNTFSLPGGGGTVTTRYNFCGTNGGGKGGPKGGFCSTPTRNSGGQGGHAGRGPRGCFVKQQGPIVNGKQTYTTVPNSSGESVPQSCAAPGNCCGGGGPTKMNAYDFSRRQNPANYKASVANLPKPMTKGPYQETRGNGRRITMARRNVERSITQNCVLDRAVNWPSLPSLDGVTGTAGVGARRATVGTRPIPSPNPTPRPPNWQPTKIVSPKPGGDNTSFREGSRIEARNCWKRYGQPKRR